MIVHASALRSAAPLSAWWASALVAAVYCAAGRLSLLLAIPPGYATAVWPAAGFAVAGVLLFGRRVWPGIVLGSFFINVWTSFDATTATSILKSVSLATAIGLGAALQANVGAFLVRRFVRFPSPLDQDQDVIRFLVLVGPVSCVVSASVGVTSLLSAGVIQWPEYPFSWWTWWVGDTIGALIVTPVVLMWTGEPREVWRRRRILVAVPLTVMLSVTVTSFVYASRWEQNEIARAFDRRADILADAIRKSLDGHLEVLHSIGGLYASSPDVDRRRFRVFVERSLARHPSIQALSWDLRVADAERAAYEEAARQDGYPNFEITEQILPGKLGPAARRDEYATVYYIEPYERNESALGFDVASDPTRLEALTRARDTGEPAATARARLIQETGRQLGFLVFLPVYRHGRPHDTLEQRRQNLRGYTTAVFRIGDLIEVSLKGLDRVGFDLTIFDETAAARDRVLYVNRGGAPQPTDLSTEDPRETKPAGMHRATTLEIAGRRWTVLFSATPGYLAPERSWRAWAVLALGLFGCALLEAFLLVVTGHTTKVERLVTERTRELTQANEALELEIGERKRAAEQVEAALQEKEILLKEIHHRVKNNLQVVSSLLNLQAARLAGSEARSALKDSQNRVRLMALIHEALYRSPDIARIDFAEYVRGLAAQLLRSHGAPGRPVTLTVNVQAAFLGVDVAIPCALIIHELVSNALKHGFADGRDGEIRIDLRTEHGAPSVLSVSDTGVGLPSAVDVDNPRSLGLQLVGTLTTQLTGTLNVDRVNGTRFTIRFPADHGHRAPGLEAVAGG